MKNPIVLFAIVTMVGLASCLQLDSPQNNSKDLSNSKMVLVYSESEMFSQLELLSFDKTKTWKDIDELYRNQITITNNRDLKNNAFIFMAEYKNLLNEADNTTLNYYAAELEKTDFNFNLHTIVALIYQLSNEWGEDETKRYAKSIYEKNIRFWNENFSGKTSYLTLNKVALEDLQSIYLSNL